MPPQQMGEFPTEIEKALKSLHVSRHKSSEAGQILTDLASLGDGVVGKLIAAVDSPEPEVRSGAALALGYVRFYSDGKIDVAPALPALLRSANDNDSWVAFHAARSVSNIEVEGRGIDGLSQEAVSRVATFLHSSNPQVRVAAAEMLGMAEPAGPALIAALDDPVVDVRCAAADALSKLGPIAVDAMPKLMAWTNSRVPEERFFGCAAVMAVDPLHHPALAPVLMAALEHLEGEIRIKAIYALGRRIETANQAVPLLIRLHRESQDHDLRLAVVSVLAGFGSDVQDTLPMLIEAVRDADREVAAAAARGLGAWGPAAEAASVLMEVLDAELARDEHSNRRDRDLREELIDLARTALEGIGVDELTAAETQHRGASTLVEPFADDATNYQE